MGLYTSCSFPVPSHLTHRFQNPNEHPSGVAAGSRWPLHSVTPNSPCIPFSSACYPPGAGHPGACVRFFPQHNRTYSTGIWCIARGNALEIDGDDTFPRRTVARPISPDLKNIAGITLSAMEAVAFLNGLWAYGVLTC